MAMIGNECADAQMKQKTDVETFDAKRIRKSALSIYSIGYIVWKSEWIAKWMEKIAKNKKVTAE